MKTGVITYNVRERGRRHRGVERNFDTASLAAVVNGPAVQEKVRNRDLQGYYGHWPRTVFGMEPREGGVVDGKVVRIEPALVTTSIQAGQDGTIEHEVEFLDTAPGRTAKRLWGSRSGGFSSAISARQGPGGKDIVTGFYGFDYVLEPNFAGNRGFALDGVQALEGAALLDSVAESEAQTLIALDAVYTALQTEYERLAEAHARRSLECDALIAELARSGPRRPADEVLARLDAAFQRPAVAAPRKGLLETAAEFDSMPLVERVRADAQPTPAGRRLAQVIDNFFPAIGRR